MQSRHIDKYAGGEQLTAFALKVLRGEIPTAVATPQFSLTTVDSAGHVETRIYHKRFAPPPSQKRVIIIGSENCLRQTVPFGFH